MHVLGAEGGEPRRQAQGGRRRLGYSEEQRQDEADERELDVPAGEGWHRLVTI
jgi:hypothetical protein